MTSPAPGLAALDKQLHPRFLTLAEREQVCDLRAAGQSLRAIGRALGRPASTVLREIRVRSDTDGYQPYAAHPGGSGTAALAEGTQAPGRWPAAEFVADGLRRRWSPEQIRHALRREHPGDQSMRVSVETICQALYLQARGGLKRKVQAAVRTGRTRASPAVTPASAPSGSPTPWS